MFVINERLTGIPGEDERKIVSVLLSINEPKIAADNRTAESTRAYICTLTEGKEFGVRIVLYQAKGQLRLVYEPEEGLASKDARREIEDSALDFVENMGFMMDNLNIGKLAAEERKQVLADLPIFEQGFEDTLRRKILEAEKELESLKSSKTIDSVPTVSRAKFKKEAEPEPEPVEADDAVSLEELEAEFRREDIGSNEMDAAIDSVLSPSSASVSAKVTGAATGASSAKSQSLSLNFSQTAVEEKEPEGVAALEPTRLRTLVRFLSSF